MRSRTPKGPQEAQLPCSAIALVANATPIENLRRVKYRARRPRAFKSPQGSLALKEGRYSLARHCLPRPYHRPADGLRGRRAAGALLACPARPATSCASRRATRKRTGRPRDGTTRETNPASPVAARGRKTTGTLRAAEATRRLFAIVLSSSPRNRAFRYCSATAALARSRTSLRDHGFEVNRTPSGRTMFETGLPDVTRTST